MTTIYPNWSKSDVECPRRLINRLVVPAEWKEGEGCPYTVEDLSDDGVIIFLAGYRYDIPADKFFSEYREVRRSWYWVQLD